MSWQVADLGDWSGRTVVLTGGNSGIGLAAARGLVRQGAQVVLACRDAGRAERARASISGPGRATVDVLDLSDLADVAAFAGRTEKEHPRLDALVCNAGIMGGAMLGTAQGHERQMGTNHLGHAALVAGLFPSLERAGGRVVSISSIAARGGTLGPAMTEDDLVSPAGYQSQAVYANTKQANLLFAQELHRRVGDRVGSVAAHPGVSWTNLFVRQLRDDGKGWLVPAAKLIGPVVLQSAAAGAAPTLRALDPATPSGAFVGPRSFNQYRGRPELLEVYRTGSDPATAARLWELTEHLLGVRLPS